MALVCSYTTTKFVCDTATLIRSLLRSGKHEKIGLFCRSSLQYRNLEIYDFFSAFCTRSSSTQYRIFFREKYVSFARTIETRALFDTTLSSVAPVVSKRLHHALVWDVGAAPCPHDGLLVESWDVMSKDDVQCHQPTNQATLHGVSRGEQVWKIFKRVMAQLASEKRWDHAG